MILSSLVERLRPRRVVPPARDVLFYAASWIDETWVRSTIAACKARGLRCVLAVGGPVPPEQITSYRDAGVDVLASVPRAALAAARAPVAVTASSGVPRALFGRNVINLVHMPHSIVSLHMVYPEDAFDGYDVLFAAGPHHVAEFAAMSKRLGRERRSLPVGYGKADLLSADVMARSGRPHVLLAPSWGPQSLLPTVGQDLIALLLQGQWRVTLRPHPLHVLEKDAAYEQIRAAFEGAHDFAIELPSAPPRSMDDAEVMITDYSGTAFEYALLRARPVVFADVPRKIVNPNWQSLGLAPVEVALRDRIGVVVRPEASGIAEAAARMREDAGAWRARIRDAVPSFTFRRSGVGETACEAIQALLAGSGAAQERTKAS